MNVADRLHLEGLEALQGKNFAAAVRLLQAAIFANPLIAQAHNNLGLALRLAGREFDAILAFEQAIGIDSAYLDAHYNLGVVLQERGARSEAEREFRTVISINAEHLRAHYSLAEILAHTGRRKAAAAHLHDCLCLDPDDCLGAAIFLAALGEGPLPVRASDGHLDRLYRQRAASWDDASSYKAHKAVALLLGEVSDVSAAHVLDLGCGIGLVGTQLAPLPKYLHGVNRSDDMLRLAASKGIYQSLYQADVLDFMEYSGFKYDAITAAALVIHYGNLDPLMLGVAALLTGSGVFTFSIYSNDGQDKFGLSAHFNLDLAKAGCFAHGSAYVAQAARHAGLRVFAMVPIIHETSLSCSATGFAVAVTVAGS